MVHFNTDNVKQITRMIAFAAEKWIFLKVGNFQIDFHKTLQ